MPDRRQHRGPHPQDEELFATARVEALRQAVAELSWLLSRGYAPASSLKLVGDRYDLTVRQRVAVARSACSDQARAARLARLRPPNELAGQAVIIDGYNLLITLESALGGGVILGARDSTFRDLASLHGSYREIAETQAALELAGNVLAELGATDVRWLLDKPVSNSGRLEARMVKLAAQRGWPWTVDLSYRVDADLIAGAPLITRGYTGPAARETCTPSVLVVSSDSVVLDACGPWVNLARHAVERNVAGAWVIDLE